MIQTQQTEEQKAVAIKEKNALVEAGLNEEDFLDSSADIQDLLIPKILLMQGVSQAVNDEKAMAGDMIDSVSLEKLGSGREKDYKEIPVVALTSNKTWVVHEIIDGQPDWKEEVPMTAENQNWAQEEVVDGVLLRRDRSINFYLLRADQLDDPTAIPYMISFRRTAYRTGRQLSSHFSRCDKANHMIRARRQRGEDVPYVKPCATIWNLGAKKTSNDTNTWWVPTLEKGGDLDPQYLGVCGQWLKMIRQGNHTVDQSEFKETDTVTNDTVDDVGGEQREF